MQGMKIRVESTHCSLKTTSKKNDVVRAIITLHKYETFIQILREVDNWCSSLEVDKYEVVVD